MNLDEKREAVEILICAGEEHMTLTLVHLEAAYRLIESDDELRLEWFGR